MVRLTSPFPSLVLLVMQVSSSPSTEMVASSDFLSPK